MRMTQRNSSVFKTPNLFYQNEDLLSAGRRSRSHALLLLPQAVALLLLLKMKFVEDGINRKVE
jgi:hypothetical protein